MSDIRCHLRHDTAQSSALQCEGRQTIVVCGVDASDVVIDMKCSAS